MPLKGNSRFFQELASKKIIKPENLEDFSSSLKKEGKTIATLNGSFDLLHPGHLEIIASGAAKADVLLMLLNTDSSIRANKGNNRPIHDLSARLCLLAALELVDFVSWFDEKDPCTALKIIKPDVHVNGEEYGEDCIEADVVQHYGGKIHIVKLVSGYSTSNMIKKIKLCV